MAPVVILSRTIGLSKSDPDRAQEFVVIGDKWMPPTPINDETFGNPDPVAPGPTFKPKLTLKGNP